MLGVFVKQIVVLNIGFGFCVFNSIWEHRLKIFFDPKEPGRSGRRCCYRCCCRCMLFYDYIYICIYMYTCIHIYIYTINFRSIYTENYTELYKINRNNYPYQKSHQAHQVLFSSFTFSFVIYNHQFACNRPDLGEAYDIHVVLLYHDEHISAQVSQNPLVVEFSRTHHGCHKSNIVEDNAQQNM